MFLYHDFNVKPTMVIRPKPLYYFPTANFITT